jgi:hypothetical protein
MEQKSNTLVKSAMSFGLYLGLAVIAYTVLLYALGETTNKMLSYVSFLIYLIGAGWAVKTYRDKTNGGYIEFGQAYLLSFLVFVFSGIIVSFFSFILFKYIDPSLMDQIWEQAQEEAMKKGVSEEQLAQSEKVMKMFQSPMVMFIAGIINSAIIGAVLSLIIAAVFKRKGNPYEQMMQEVKENE